MVNIGPVWRAPAWADDRMAGWLLRRAGEAAPQIYALAWTGAMAMMSLPFALWTWAPAARGG